MALNQIYKDADGLSYNLGAVNPNIDSGDFVVLGGIRGVAETDAELRADGNYWVTLRHIGVFAAETTEAATVGEAFYLDAAATSGLTVTDDDNLGANFLVGYAVAPKSVSVGAEAVWIRVNN